MLRPLQKSEERLRGVGTEPDYRFSLANERTFLAYLRTALALYAAGAAVLAVVDIVADPVLDRVLGASLVALGILTAATSYGRWRRIEEALRRSAPLPHSVVPRLLAAALAVLGLITVLALILQ